MLTTLVDIVKLKAKSFHKKTWWGTPEWKTKDITQSNLGQNTNTPTIVPSLYFYEAIYFKMICVAKMCYDKWSYATLEWQYSWTSSKGSTSSMDPFLGNIRISILMYL